MRELQSVAEACRGVNAMSNGPRSRKMTTNLALGDLRKPL
jgi:hypothetical protein